MSKQKIAATGLSGVLGKIFANEIKNDFSLTDLNRSSLDLLNTNKISRILDKMDFDTFIHFAAVTHIDKCEADKINGKNGLVWKTNVKAVEEIAKYCETNNKRLVLLSTECVFDGKNGQYKENDTTSPINWYGFSKAAAEEKAMSICSNTSIIRGVITYYPEEEGLTIWGNVLHRLRKNKKMSAVVNQNISPTYTPDFSRAIKKIIGNNLTGIFHVSPDSITSPYKMAKKIANVYSFDEDLIEESTLLEYFGIERSRLRLKNATLNNVQSKKRLGFTPASLDEILKKVSL